MKVRFGVGLGADTGPDELPELIDRLERLGIDSLWFSELVYSKAVDPFVGMAYALARARRLKVGTSVVVLPGRHPVLVAKQLASLAALAPRRVLPVFGLRSAIPAERELFAVPDGQRAAMFDESLRLLRSSLEADGTTSSPSRPSRLHHALPNRSTSGSAAPRPPHLRASAASPTVGWAVSSRRPRHVADASRSSMPRRTRAAPSSPTTSASTSQ